MKCDDRDPVILGVSADGRVEICITQQPGKPKTDLELTPEDARALALEIVRWSYEAERIAGRRRGG